MTNTSQALVAERHWKRPDIIHIDVPSGFVSRLVRKDWVERRLGEGWELYKKKDNDKQETASMDGRVHYRGLIVMLMPKNMAEERNQYYIDRHTQRLRSGLSGATMNSEAEKINSAQKGNLTGAIGRSMIQEGLIRKDGSSDTERIKHFDGQKKQFNTLEEAEQSRKGGNK